MKVKQCGATRGGGRLVRYTEKGAANAALASAMPAPGANWRLAFLAVSYSAAPTQAGASVKLDAGEGADYDAELLAGSANAQHTIYPQASSGVDPAGPIFGGDDGLSVSAPAGGAGITAAVSIYIEVF